MSSHLTLRGQLKALAQQRPAFLKAAKSICKYLKGRERMDQAAETIYQYVLSEAPWKAWLKIKGCDFKANLMLRDDIFSEKIRSVIDYFLLQLRSSDGATDYCIQLEASVAEIQKLTNSFGDQNVSSFHIFCGVMCCSSYGDGD